MNRTNQLFTTGALLIIAGSPVLANEIYKYTDTDGTVHYVDRPTGAPSEEVVRIASRSSSTTVSGQSDNKPDWRERRAAREEAKQAANTARAEQEQREQACTESRARLEQYSNAQRLYRTDEQGERVYLDDQQVEEARQRVEELIRENCQ